MMSQKTMLKLWTALLKIAALILKAAPARNAALARSFFHKVRAFVTVYQFGDNQEQKGTVFRMYQWVYDCFRAVTMDKEGPAEQLDDLTYKELVGHDDRSYLQPALHALWLLKFNDAETDLCALGHMLKWARLAGVPDAELLKITGKLPRKLRNAIDMDVAEVSDLEIGDGASCDADEESGEDTLSEVFDWKSEARGDVTARDPKKDKDDPEKDPDDTH